MMVRTMSNWPQLTSHEREVLEMLAGTREAEWGAWVAACLEFLQESGFATRGLKPQITEAGRQALVETGGKS
jgi:hypothetical protein